MTRYLPLLSIAVSHEYLGGMPLRLRFVPTAECAAVMQRAGLLLRPTPGGAELWCAAPAPDAPLALAFDVFSSDPQLQFCTAWPVARPLRFVGAGAESQLQAETLAGSGAARGPLFSVEIAHPPGLAACPVYRIALAARKMHWKYFFSGSLAGKALRIVDLDGGDDGQGVRFSASDWPATPDGAAYTSDAPLPMQRIPQQRLQLREEGGTGKVLIKRLPNADMEKLGKERGRDGQSMIVAEIYIHQ